MDDALHVGKCRVLVLTPTRELAAQVLENMRAYSRHLPLRSDVVFGGVKINPQIARLQDGVDVLVATPGRLLDLHQQRMVAFDRLETLVLDEADRMLDMGFIHDIRKLIRLLPEHRQTLLFSATFSAPIRKLATGLLHKPLQIQVAPENQTARSVDQVVHPCDMKRKPELLSHLIRSGDWQQVLVFSRTKHGANRVAERLNKEGLASAAIHGNKSQGARLVLSRVSSKGMCVFSLQRILLLAASTFSNCPTSSISIFPNVAEDYVHRIGRTGRAGETGHAISLVAAEEALLLKAIERLTGEALRKETVKRFEPTILSAPPLDLSGGRRNQGNSPRRRQDQRQSTILVVIDSATTSLTHRRIVSF